MLKSIAKSGLKGRRRQTRILLIALGLAFFFMTVSLILLGTSNTNRQAQRQAAFGEWDGVYVRDTKEMANLLTDQGLIVGQTRLIGHDDRLGLIAEANQSFWDLGNIDVLEGRLPSELDEIVLEQGQLSYFATTPKVGDKIQVTFKVKYADDDEDDISFSLAPFAEDIISRYRWAVVEHWDRMPEMIEKAYEAELDTLDDRAQAAVGWTTDFETGRELTLDEIKTLYEEVALRTRDEALNFYANGPETDSSRYDYLVQEVINDNEQHTKAIAEFFSRNSMI